MLSVPRDLKVEIPQGGTVSTSKLNAAYSIGGPNLLVKILKQQVFHGLQVNHIVDVNFKGFSDLVDAIGCVYTDVDHRYYNDTSVTNYSSIDIQPGYQKLCGDNQSTSGALAFVRFRHTDTDIVRNARQQDFLRWAKSQFNGSTLLSERDRLLQIFGKNSQTDHDLHTTDGLINIFNLVAFSAGHTVKQIPFPAIIPALHAAVLLRARQPRRRAARVPPVHDADQGGARETRRPAEAQRPQAAATAVEREPVRRRRRAARLRCPRSATSRSRSTTRSCSRPARSTARGRSATAPPRSRRPVRIRAAT